MKMFLVLSLLSLTAFAQDADKLINTKIDQDCVALLKAKSKITEFKSLKFTETNRLRLVCDNVYQSNFHQCLPPAMKLYMQNEVLTTEQKKDLTTKSMDLCLSYGKEIGSNVIDSVLRVAVVGKISIDEATKKALEGVSKN